MLKRLLLMDVFLETLTSKEPLNSLTANLNKEIVGGIFEKALCFLVIMFTLGINY